MLFEMHHSMFFCHSQIKLLDPHHHTWSVSSTWLQGGGSGDTQSMSGGTNEPQHRLLFPNNSPQPSSLISHHPNTPTPTWATLLCTPLPTVTQLLSPHPRNQQMHTAHNTHNIYTESAYTHIHIHTQNIHRIGTSTQSVHSCQTLSVSQFGRGARMCANTSIRRTETWQCVEELGIPLRNFFFQVDRKSALVKRNTLIQALNCVKIFIDCEIDSSS